MHPNQHSKHKCFAIFLDLIHIQTHVVEGVAQIPCTNVSKCLGSRLRAVIHSRGSFSNKGFQTSVLQKNWTT